jgi:hypothetical protein
MISMDKGADDRDNGNKDGRTAGVTGMTQVVRAMGTIGKTWIPIIVIFVMI